MPDPNSQNQIQSVSNTPNAPNAPNVPNASSSVTSIPTPPVSPRNPSVSGNGTGSDGGQGQNQGQGPFVTNQNAPAQAPSQTQNPSAPPPTPPSHPAMIHAGILHDVATTLAGGPRYTTTIDPDTGVTTRTQVPLRGSQIAMALALEAISGSLAGLGAKGPNAVGQAAGLGLQQGQQIAQQNQTKQAQQDAQAQNDLRARTDALNRQAQAFELNSRMILNSAQAERMGLDTMKDTIAVNAPVLAAYDDADQIIQKGVSQDALMAGMKSGDYKPTEQTAIPDGFTLVNGKPELTFSLAQNPSAQVSLSPETARAFGDAGIPGFTQFAGGKTAVAQGVTVPGYILGRATQQLNAINLMRSDVGNVVNTLSQSDDFNNQQLAKTIPNLQAALSNPQAGGASLQTALFRFQKYVSHTSNDGLDLYQSLQQMAQPSKPNPNNSKGPAISNPDAPFAQTIAGYFGSGDPQRGWNTLKAYSDEITPEQITNEGQAADMIASSEPGSRAYNYAQRWIASNTAQKAAVARAGAEVRAEVKAANDAAANSATSGQPDALGFTPNVAAIGGVKEYNKRFNQYKKNVDDLARTDASYQQFGDTLNTLAQGSAMSGAQSVVALFNAIGLSATPLAGRGFRITENTIKEHEQARGWGQALQAKLLNAQNGDVITPQQLRDYANIAQQARQTAHVQLANELHSVGLSADPALPMGNGQKIDRATANIFLALTNNNATKARQAAIAKGWQF